MLRLFQIDVKYFCCGIVSKDDIIIDAAPIMAWSIGKKLKDIKPRLISKNAKVKECVVRE